MNENDGNKLKDIVSPLLQWYKLHARVLPWREDPQAYRVWVSEIMLQQTRVEAVKPYYERFLKALPTIESLAKAEEEVLLKLWEGLGYYNRVRNMQKAAQVVIEQYHGVLPDDYEALLKLPGIGSYTAGAIASIAYNKSVPAVDGNVLRVISRILASEDDVSKQSVKRQAEELLLKIMPQDQAGDFNQALMELGATVCVPNGLPKCEQCPLGKLCIGRRLGIAETLPRKAPKKERRIEHKTVLVIQDGEKVALRKRGSKGLLAGLYEFPNHEGYMTSEEAIEWVKEEGFLPIRIQKLAPAKHIFSHVEWRMKGYAIRIGEVEQSFRELHPPFIFADIKKTEVEYPVPAAFAAYMEYFKNLGSIQEKD